MSTKDTKDTAKDSTEKDELMKLRDAVLASMQPNTYWEKRCYMLEQFVEKVIAVTYNKQPKGTRDMIAQVYNDFKQALMLLEREQVDKFKPKASIILPDGKFN